MEIFENNLLLLSRSNSKLTAALKHLKTPRGVKVFPSKSGLPTAEVQIPSGYSTLLHSAFNPQKEAESWVRQQNKSADIIILLGLGLGYPALSFLNSGFSGKLIIVEKDIGIFKLALLHCDLSIILNNVNTVLFVGKEANGLLPFINKTATGSVRYMMYLPVVSLHHQFYESIALSLDKIIYEQRRLINKQLSDGIEKMLQVMKG